MSETDPNLGLTYAWPLGTTPWNTDNDANLKKIGAILGLSVTEIGTETPPVGPSNGDRYVFGATPSGAWAGEGGNVAVYIESAWEFYTPATGWLAYNESDTNLYLFNGVAWKVYAMQIGI